MYAAHCPDPLRDAGPEPRALIPSTARPNAGPYSPAPAPSPSSCAFIEVERMPHAPETCTFDSPDSRSTTPTKALLARFESGEEILKRPHLVLAIAGGEGHLGAVRMDTHRKGPLNA